MISKENQKSAIVFGLFETALGVARSLGRIGINVIGIDYHKDIAYYSKYVHPLICPHPVQDEKSFLIWLKNNFKEYKYKIPIFITSDDFLYVIAKNQNTLADLFEIHMIDYYLLLKISDKFAQYLLAQKSGINCPVTWLLEKESDLESLRNNSIWPLFIKGRDVNSWRSLFGGSLKGFLVSDFQELRNKVEMALKNSVPVIVQEMIVGKDTNHFKYCAYIDKKGEIKAEILLQKIRQYPIRYGVGSAVKTIDFPELLDAGRKFFRNINYKGVGSAEFKIDDKDGKLKLIELNPRYWQQNSIGEFSGVNFPLINYYDLTGISYDHKPMEYEVNNLWVNRYSDFASFIAYRKEGILSFLEWRKSLKGKKVYSDFAWDDPVPMLYEFGFGIKLLRLPIFLWKKIAK